jgi:hypothetical protein
MSLLTLTFFIPPIRTCRIKTRAVTDPTQYDVEINTARGFKLHTPVKTKTKESPIDPAQFDTEENVVRKKKKKKD